MIDRNSIADTDSDKRELGEVVMGEDGAIARATEKRVLENTCKHSKLACMQC